ncbi:hypothetical protein SODALDRAFT_360470 [Sodiomyces alkalinus F11]|uniref:Uncharacterized protein n=1 Tax=Sodiomyces alkalinus (strain CBS 110278 / VKM F-3762 / F11) TaxID=1314773 RepID=A0A3N2PUF3_SODAK|nr:hypothetical protein SODALDRAFT_360470 [Sodiomyces alkalinus F11]ROT38135.1 hypothetical protein SODALDRAFT_360470 [Sodiomyces alkalinus F11]
MTGKTYCKRHEICVIPGCHTTPDTHPDAGNVFVCPKRNKAASDLHSLMHNPGPTYEEFYRNRSHPRNAPNTRPGFDVLPGCIKCAAISGAHPRNGTNNAAAETSVVVLCLDHARDVLASVERKEPRLPLLARDREQSGHGRPQDRRPLDDYDHEPAPHRRQSISSNDSDYPLRNKDEANGSPLRLDRRRSVTFADVDSDDYPHYRGLGSVDNGPSPHNGRRTDIDHNPASHRPRASTRNESTAPLNHDGGVGGASSHKYRDGIPITDETESEESDESITEREESSRRRLQQQRQDVLRRREQRAATTATHQAYQAPAVESPSTAKVRARSPSLTPSLVSVRDKTMRGANPSIPGKKGEEKKMQEELKKREDKLKQKGGDLKKNENELKTKQNAEKRKQELFIQAAREELSKFQDTEYNILRNQFADFILTRHDFHEQKKKLQQKHSAQMLNLENELRWRFANEDGFDPYPASPSTERNTSCLAISLSEFGLSRPSVLSLYQTHCRTVNIRKVGQWDGGGVASREEKPLGAWSQMGLTDGPGQPNLLNLLVLLVLLLFLILFLPLLSSASSLSSSIYPYTKQLGGQPITIKTTADNVQVIVRLSHTIEPPWAGWFFAITSTYILSKLISRARPARVVSTVSRADLDDLKDNTKNTTPLHNPLASASASIPTDVLEVGVEDISALESTTPPVQSPSYTLLPLCRQLASIQ